MKNYYEVLEVDRHASLSVIKGVYKIHIKECHPDLFQGEEKLKAEEKLKEFNEAYEVLSDDIKRAEYDKTLENEYEERLLELQKENERLRKAYSFNESIDENMDNAPLEEEYEKPYEYNSENTSGNNTKYLFEMMWKERLIRLMITIGIVIAFFIGIYKSTGYNILKIIWDAFIKAF